MCRVCDVECVMCDVGCGRSGGRTAGGRRTAAGCNDKNKNPTIECGEKPGSSSSRIFELPSLNI